MNAHSSYDYEMYKRELRKQDVDYIEDFKILKSILRGKFSSAEFRSKFLQQKYEENKLFCVYCGEPVKWFTAIFWTKKDKILHKTRHVKDPLYATIEHFNAISSGGLRFTYSNTLCACSKCNNDRGSLPAFKVTEDKYVY